MYDFPTRAVADIESLIPTGMFAGAGVIVRDQERFVLAVRPPKMRDGQLILEITALGGGRLPEDRTLLDTVRRELREEAECEVEIQRCERTLVVHSGARVEWVTLGGVAHPAVAVYRNHPTDPHNPWQAEGPSRPRPGCLVLFLGRLFGNPQPTGEVPGLIWLTAGQIMILGRRDVPLRRLLGQGALLQELRPGILPRTGLARLTDSQDALCVALKKQAYRFYRRLAAGSC